jgi:hypothetical protein
MDSSSAEAIALNALAFLAQDRARMTRFLELTGLAPDELREAASTPELQRAVLEHLSGDESLLLVFAAGHGVAPECIARALTVFEASDT